MVNSRAAYRRRQSRRSTVFFVAGLILIGVGVLLTVTAVGGNVVPTVLALVGVGLLIAGVAIGANLIAENARYHQSQSFYDEQ